MGLPWLKVSSDLPNHPKSLDLAAVLDDPRAWTYVLELWLWCGRSAPDGRICGRQPVAMVERAAGWRGIPGGLAIAMASVGFLDEVEGGYQVHDWAEHNAAHQAKLERDRAHQAKRRADLHESRNESQRVASDSSATRPQIAGEIERESKKKKKEEASAGADAPEPAAEPSGPEPGTAPASPQAQEGPSLPAGEANGDAPDPTPPLLALAPQKPAKARKERRPSRQEALWVRMQAARAQALPDAPEDPGPGFARVNKLLGEAIAQLGEAGVERAWAEYLRDPWARGLDLPCVLTAFGPQKRAECLARADKRRPAAANTAPGACCAACGGAPETEALGGPACYPCLRAWQAAYLEGHPEAGTWDHLEPGAAEEWRAWCARRRAA